MNLVLTRGEGVENPEQTSFVRGPFCSFVEEVEYVFRGGFAVVFGIANDPNSLKRDSASSTHYAANRIEIEQGCPVPPPPRRIWIFTITAKTPADFHNFAHDDGGAAVRSVRRTVGSGLSLKGHRSRPSVNCLWKRDKG